MKKKFRQIIYDMRTQPVISAVTIIGTALSIFLLMSVMMLQQIGTMPFAPESNRDRLLFGKYIHIEYEHGGSSGSMSYEAARKLYSGLEGVEVMTIMSPEPNSLDVKAPGTRPFTAYVRRSDENFWKVFDYKLLKGRLYTVDEVNAGSRVAVVTEETARRLFGTEDPVGRHFLLDHNDFEVIGVVNNASQLASNAFGEVFAPIDVREESAWNKWFGDCMATLLVAEGVDKEDVRSLVQIRYKQFDAELSADGQSTVYHGAPFDQETYASGIPGSNGTPDPASKRKISYLIYAILLLVPAINLSSMLHSRLRRRVRDLGVRRAFGCTRSRIIGDIIAENFIVTLAGGIIGLAAGIIFAMTYDGLYEGFNGTSVRPALNLLLNWRIIGIATGICFILNIICASVPAWQASRVNPVDALNAR